MKIVIFSLDNDIINLWKHRLNDNNIATITEDEIKNHLNDIVLVDYNSVANEFNKLISSNKVPNFAIVLERTPAIATGKMLIKHGIKAYGNSAMLSNHFNQMIQTVQNGDVWTYPELTAALLKRDKEIKLNQEAKELIDLRLSPKEKEVLFGILEGLTNEAIANKLEISTRTVKAHVSSIFEKLHVNDRLSLALLLLSN
jgi:DNA-binding NarL/FixJ family response regulator